MNFQKYELRKISPVQDEYELILHLHDSLTEFGAELGSKPDPKNDLMSMARQVMRERYPAVKITIVKVLIGGMTIASFPLMGGMAAAAASPDASGSTGTGAVSDGTSANSIYYQVASGDTLYVLSKKFNTTIDNIKRANGLTTDVLQINQRLIIPKAFHTISQGDYLSVLAKNYGTTAAAIKEANGLASDAVFLGQTLIIPAVIGSQSPAAVTPSPAAPAPASSYTVAAGDSLSVIAKRFGVTVEALKSANQLTSDLLRVGQVLAIPASGSTGAGTVQQPAQTTSYTVASGDSLSVIAKRFGTSVEALKSANQLSSDFLRVGQVLAIPAGGTTGTGTVQQPAQTVSASYTVASGDSLSAIAKRFGITVDALKTANQLTSDTIRVGQVLTIPNGQTNTAAPQPAADANVEKVQRNLQTLGYYAVPAITGSYDDPTKQAIRNFQSDYQLPVTGSINEATATAIEHAITKKALVQDTTNFLGVPYVWGGTTPSGFDCSGFVYYMFNKHGVNMARNTSQGLYTTGTTISQSQLQPGDLVFFAVNSTGTISHVGFYLGNNQFVSATNSKGIAVYPLNSGYWASYYVGAKRVY